MAKVDMVKEGDTAGVFLTNSMGQMALLAQEQNPSLYISFRPEGWQIPYALAIGTENKLTLQIPNSDGSGVSHNLDLTKLAEAVSALQKN